MDKTEVKGGLIRESVSSLAGPASRTANGTINTTGV